MGRWGRVRLLAVALACVVAFVVLGRLALGTSAGASVDRWVADAVLDGVPAWLRRALDALARPWLLVVLAPVDAALALVAVARRPRRVRLALAATLVVVVPLGLGLAVDLGALLGLPDDGYPSDHATAGLALVTALALLWPRPLGRRELAAAASLAVVVLLGNVAWYAHRPSDVIGSALLVGAVTAGALAAVGVAPARALSRPRSRSEAD